MAGNFDAVMFDLDGTLADSLDDIAAAGNHALARLGYPPIDTPRYRQLAGQGLPWLITHALGPQHADQVDAGISLFRDYYRDHYLDHTRPYDGIPALLDELTRRGLKLAVLSNKPDAATQVVVREVLGQWRFDAVVGNREGQALKPDPQAALGICRALGVEPARGAYVGDTRVDMQTARSAGLFAVGVLWGFRDEAELRDAGAQAIIARPHQLLELL